MSGYAEALLERVEQARAKVAAAVAKDDPYALAVAQDDLEDALRVARRHGLNVRDEDEG
ncbi:hypothetical protein ACFQVC_06640 [Streptomyces monticola]|uniref:Uncharacterized protein n=1 Tax=Streptomyces monticola TaxID=2666263 RepID=A0ABW2JE95_9ACTN